MTQLLVGPLSSIEPLARPAPTVALDATLGQAARAMREANESAVLVEGGGILTERDLTTALALGLGADDPVATVTVERPVTVSPDVTVVDAAAMMLRESVRHLVVCPIGSPVAAVLSVRQLLAVLLQATDPTVWAMTLHLDVGDHAEI